MGGDINTISYLKNPNSILKEPLPTLYCLLWLNESEILLWVRGATVIAFVRTLICLIKGFS